MWTVWSDLNFQVRTRFCQTCAECYRARTPITTAHISMRVLIKSELKWREIKCKIAEVDAARSQRREELLFLHNWNLQTEISTVQIGVGNLTDRIFPHYSVRVSAVGVTDWIKKETL